MKNDPNADIDPDVLFAEEIAEYEAKVAAKRKAEARRAEVIKLVPKEPDPLREAIHANERVEDWATQELRRLEQAHREFEEEQSRLARDPVRSNHYNTAYRRTLGQAPQAHERYYAAGEMVRATHEARLAQSRYQSFSVSPTDSDADLHVSPEAQIWR